MMKIHPNNHPIRTNTFQGRFRLNPRQKNVLTGTSTAAGGAATLGSEAVAISQGLMGNPASMVINALVGLWNTHAGYQQIKRNGGLSVLKEPR